MGQYIGQYLKALTATIVAMVLYCLSVVPLIEPTEQKRYEIPSDPGIEVTNSWWQKLFNETDWQRQDPTVVHNARGVLLAKQWEQIRPESWKLTPLTIILAEKSSEDSLGDQVDPKNVMIITAQEAIIHFEQPFDMRSTMPSVQKGMLSGEIVISQVNTSDPNARPWALRTRDVSIDRRRIWTQQEVSIDFDNSRIRGHDLRINLLSDILSKRTDQTDDWATKYGPLEEIELLHLTELSVALKPGGIWANVGPEMLQLNQPAINLPARVEATCGGRFTFNFSKEMMSLTGGVHLKHFLGGLPPDEFLCHRMNLQLQSPQESTDAKKSPSSSGIAVRDIEAFGIDSLEEFVGEKWVELRSPVVGATARAKRMHYNLTNQRVELFGKLEQAGATVSIAELNYRGYQFQAPTLQYQPAPKGPDGRALHGGWMAAQGAGELSSPPDSRMGEMHVRWQDKFTWSPTNVPGEQLIELSGQTLVEQKKQGFLTAETLQIWLAAVPRAEQLSAALTPNHQAWNGLQPKRIQSKGKSVIATNKARVNVQTLDLKFAYPHVPAGDLVSQPSTSIKNPLERFVGQPPLGAQPANSSSGDQPIEVDGQSLVATIAMASKQAWIDAMTIHGPLILKSPDGQTAPWKVDGTALHLASSPQGELDVEIEGTPAMIHVADGSIQGPRIGFNQKQNRIWMDQPGEFTLPMNLKSGPSNLQWVKPLTCRWKKRMTFDGTKIRFEGDIDLFGTMQQTDGLWYVKGTCQELDLLMAQPLSLGQLGNLQQVNSTSQLQQIVLRENVDLLASHRDNIGNRLSVGRLKVPTTLTIQVDQETIRAAGPGRCYSNFVSNRDVGSTVSLRQDLPNLDSIGLAYRDSLVVFMARREVVVDGNVKILMTPIQSWDQEPNPDNVTRLTEGQFSCNCDQVKVYDTGSLNSTQSTLSLQGRSIGAAQWEAQATGNVRFDGNTESGEYSGNAYQIVYVQAKNLLRVAGDGRSKAMIKKLATFANGKSEPATTWNMNSGLFNVKNRGMLDSSGIEVHIENQNQPGTSSELNTLPNGQVNPQNPGMGPAGPNSPPIDPRDRAINNLLRGYGS